nr:glycosyltransferase 87 family protein [Defluviimonas sediminis]
MLPPDAWAGETADEVSAGVIYPFVYPPLWAWVGWQAHGIGDFETVSAIASILNPLMIAAMLIMAHRLSAPGMSQGLFVGTGILFFWFSMVGSMALYQKQPQVVVAFLSVLAIFCGARGWPRMAGTALAFAAAIKLFPAFLAIFWLASGQRRAVVAFALAGALLAALSVAVAGWPLHETFLHQVGLISSTSLLTRLNYSVEAVLTAAMFPGAVEFVAAVRTGMPEGAQPGWFVVPEPFLSNLAFTAALAGAIAWLARGFRRTGGQVVMLWPLALMILTLLSPIAWAYYFLAPLAFLPAIFDRFSPFRAMALFLIPLTLTSPFVQTWVLGPPSGIDTHRIAIQILGVLSMGLLTGAFWAICRRDRMG